MSELKKEIGELWNIGICSYYPTFEEVLTRFAEKHSKAVLEDYIKSQSSKNDKVNTTYAGEIKWGDLNIPSKFEVKKKPSDDGVIWRTKEEIIERYGDKEFGRVYSDLEGDMEKRSSAKNEARETCCKEPKNQPKFNIDDEVFYINQHGEIQKDTIIRVTTDDYGDNTVYFRYSTPMIFDENLPEERLYKSEFDLIKDLKHAI